MQRGSAFQLGLWDFVCEHHRVLLWEVAQSIWHITKKSDVPTQWVLEPNLGEVRFVLERGDQMCLTPWHKMQKGSRSQMLKLVRSFCFFILQQVLPLLLMCKGEEAASTYQL